MPDEVCSVANFSPFSLYPLRLCGCQLVIGCPFECTGGVNSGLRGRTVVAETNGHAFVDTDIARCSTYNPRTSIIRSASIKYQSFRSAERLLDRGALKGVFVMLIEQRIAVIAGTRGIAGRIGQPLSRDELPSDGFMRVDANSDGSVNYEPR
jgi:hypothetical protein